MKLSYSRVQDSCSHLRCVQLSRKRMRRPRVITRAMRIRNLEVDDASTSSLSAFAAAHAMSDLASENGHKADMSASLRME
ncbi:MAG: hypothetical protein SGPRY_014325, partial [Prymnesium sp.]